MVSNGNLSGTGDNYYAPVLDEAVRVVKVVYVCVGVDVGVDVLSQPLGVEYGLQRKRILLSQREQPHQVQEINQFLKKKTITMIHMPPRLSA
jgi:hypothetical protein